MARSAPQVATKDRRETMGVLQAGEMTSHGDALRFASEQCGDDLHSLWRKKALGRRMSRMSIKFCGVTPVV
jgi:hypothetical protein